MRSSGLAVAVALLGSAYHGLADDSAKPEATEARAKSEREAPRVAIVPRERALKDRIRPDLSPSANETAITRAKRIAAEALATYRATKDYTCVFHKRERIDGRFTPTYIMRMKARVNPESIYFKYATPHAGREAIYIKGKHGGKFLAHDVGLFKVLAGTMHLDPRGSIAMEDNRHPITEAGIGKMLETINERWEIELSPEYSDIVFHENARVGDRPCVLIESGHPVRRPDFLYPLVKVYFDKEIGLPIRFEAYDWPKKPGGSPDLVEEYTYSDLKLNVGLTDLDFDPNNRNYSYGRF